MAKAFDGLTVLEIGHMYNGPYCGLLFAQHGAKVIKFESATGDQLRFRSHDSLESHEFVMLNSSKESVIVNLKSEQGRQIFLDALDRVDVIVENLAPGAMSRLGLDPAMLCERNPRLVYASGKGYGTDGPYANMPAMDITVQAMSGVIASTGFADGPPVKTGPALVDILAGATLYSAAVTALYQRSVTGRGQLVEVSMHDAVFPAMLSPLGALYNDPDRDIPERTGNRHSGMAVTPYNVFPSSDGWVALFCFTQRHFENAMRAMALDDLISDERFATRADRIENMEALDDIIGEWTKLRSRAETVGVLLDVGVPASPVNTIHEVADDPHWRHRGMMRTVQHPRRGSVDVVGNPLKLGDSVPDELVPAPTIGSYSSEFLRSYCAYGQDEIERLFAAGVVEARAD
ncbi:CoA transferase [Citricoccus sp. NPDC055426]|uniref:CaiB/BaiF CoA transferase family protein n=1 Tax=Citricoccus sp. NPDC055426 TaxID=3155536 RepID=UPI00343FD25A